MTTFIQRQPEVLLTVPLSQKPYRTAFWHLRTYCVIKGHLPEWAFRDRGRGVPSADKQSAGCKYTVRNSNRRGPVTDGAAVWYHTQDSHRLCPPTHSPHLGFDTDHDA